MAKTRRFVDDYLLYLLARASAQVSGQFHAQLKTYGLQIAEWRVLATLSDSPGMTIGDLVAIVMLQQPTLTKIIIRMEENGWVERSRGQADGRKVTVRITDSGAKTVAKVLKDARAHEAKLLGGYSAVEAKRLKDTLRTLIERTGVTE